MFYHAENNPTGVAHFFLVLFRFCLESKWSLSIQRQKGLWEILTLARYEQILLLGDLFLLLLGLFSAGGQFGAMMKNVLLLEYFNFGYYFTAKFKENPLEKKLVPP